MAFVFALVALAIPFVSARVRSDKALSFALLAVLLAHQAASFVHVYVQALPTVSTDSSGFHYYAGVGEGRLYDSMFYLQMLHQFYSLFGSSQYLGCQVSQIAFSLGLVALIELTVLIGIDKKAAAVVAIFGLLPSCILNTSVTMREAFQLCAFLYLVYSLVHLRKQGPSAVSILIPLSAFALVLFHQGFAVFVVAVLPLSLMWALGSRPQVMIGAVGISFVVLTFFGGDVWQLMLEKSSALERITGDEGLDYVDRYAKQVFEGRTDFGVTISLGSPTEFLTTGTIVTTYYLFSPLPWQVSEMLDVVGFCEGFLRLLLFGFALRGIRNSEGEVRKERLFLFALFLFMELMWAAGTSNVGTAVRHRVPAWGVLVVLGVAGWSEAKREEVAQERPLSKREAIRQRRRRLRERDAEKIEIAQEAPANPTERKLRGRARLRAGKSPPK